MSVSDLPAVNASLNGLSTLFLLLGYWFIKRGQIERHRNCMLAAVATSTVFLASYLTYHFLVTAVTRFAGVGWSRPVYFLVLISHSVLAAAVPPLVILSLVPALRGRFERHRKLARWTWPIWVYVSITGVLVYLMLYQWFPPQ